MLRQFAGLCVLFAGGGALASWLGLLELPPQAIPVLIGVAGVVGGLGRVYPRALKPVFVGWTVAVFPLGWVVSHLVLAVLFFGVFTPVALLFRWTGRDVLRLKRDPAARTYWSTRSGPPEPRRYLSQY